MSTGFSRLEYSTPCCSVFPYDQLFALMHQYRILCCTERYHLTRSCGSLDFILHHHQLYRSPPRVWASPAATKMDSGPFRASHQYCVLGFLDAFDLLPYLASCHTCHCKYNELGQCNAGRHSACRDRLLSLQGKVRVCRASVVHEAGTMRRQAFESDGQSRLSLLVFWLELDIIVIT